MEKPTFSQVANTYMIALKRPVEFLFLEPVVTLVCIYLSLLYGASQHPLAFHPLLATC